MQRKNTFAIGEYYHIYNRGTDKRVIFQDEHDYNRFVALLYVANSTDSVDISKHFSEGRSSAELLSTPQNETLVDIGAYCLMPNHFHLLLYEKKEGGISLFMKKLATAYSMYFNKKNERSGALFEGRFKERHADTDEYLKYLFSYIHLNPIKIIDPKWKEEGVTDRITAKKYLKDYSYSSYLDYVSKRRKETVILNKEAFPDYFSELGEFEQCIDEWLAYKDLV